MYGSQTANVFMVEVGQGASPAAAHADWSAEQARAQALINNVLLGHPAPSAGAMEAEAPRALARVP